MKPGLSRGLRGVAALCVVAALASCGPPPGGQGPDAPPDVVARAAYVHDAPPSLTLYTMINNRSGSGAHTSLMINASQRVIFDPAGSVRHRTLPERQDVLYGVTPKVERLYARAHARETFHVVIQEVQVPAAVAEKALRLAEANGSVGQARCALETSAILRQLPGFESISSTWFPNNLAEQFGALPGATTRKLYDDDADDKSGAIAELGETLAREGL